MKQGKRGCVTCVTMYPFSGISYEKIVQKKDPGNGMQCDASDANAGSDRCADSAGENAGGEIPMIRKWRITDDNDH